VDGALVANNTVATAPAGNGLDVWIGGAPDYGTRFLPAYIANAAVFAQSLNAAQINGICNGQWIPVGPQTITITTFRLECRSQLGHRNAFGSNQRARSVDHQ